MSRLLGPSQRQDIVGGCSSSKKGYSGDVFPANAAVLVFIVFGQDGACGAPTRINDTLKLINDLAISSICIPQMPLALWGSPFLSFL